MKSQNEQILEALESGSKVTPLDALNKFGCFRLGARIHELKQRGYPIKTEIIRQRGKYIAEYSL